MAAMKLEAEIANDMRPFLVQYMDGSIMRLATSPYVPASEVPGKTRVATRDVVIEPSTGVSARLFLSVDALRWDKNKKLPLIVYYHGGGFCSGSAFSKLFHRYAESLCARTGAVVVSVDYRLAPEYPIPAAYDDAWVALRWAASLSDPWLSEYADPERMFLAGESAGGNIVHNMAVRAAAAPDGQHMSIEGIVLLQPFFWGSERQPSEVDRDDRPLFLPEWVDTLWPFLTAGTAGNDDPRLNPPPELVMALPCRRALITVASKDLVRDRGYQYSTWLRLGKQCHGEFFESKGEDHAFHLNPWAKASAGKLMDRVVDFISRTKLYPITYDAKPRRIIVPKIRLQCISPNFITPRDLSMSMRALV
ncbi:unnamed protein product [Urochloa decumbens]|uniref:Alpha/beta hydrolase fold-3 domain-containing protein n=1 Tax=Urochloa decumbens TaxID=240449 RepID=A0ABC9B3Q1_9POAL